jgi:hypothetical protein
MYQITSYRDGTGGMNTRQIRFQCAGVDTLLPMTQRFTQDWFWFSLSFPGWGTMHVTWLSETIVPFPVCVIFRGRRFEW